jgi:hypothetical protein
MKRCKKHPNGQMSKKGKCYSCENLKLYASPDWFKSKIKFQQARAAAKRRGLVWELTFEEWFALVTQPCVYAIRKHRRIRTGIDQKIAKHGYNKRNCHPCCAKHNLIKSDVFTHSQMLRVVQLCKIPCGNSRGGRRR